MKNKLIGSVVLFVFSFALTGNAFSQYAIGYNMNHHKTCFNVNFANENIFKKPNLGHEVFFIAKISDHIGLEYAYQHLKTADYFFGHSMPMWNVWFLSRFYMKGHSASFSINSRKFDERITLFSNIGLMFSRMVFRIRLLSIGPYKYNNLMDVKHNGVFPRASVGTKYSISEDVAIRATCGAIKMNNVNVFSPKRGTARIYQQKKNKLFVHYGLGIEISF